MKGSNGYEVFLKKSTGTFHPLADIAPRLWLWLRLFVATDGANKTADGV
jgi:hypothetical protein